MMLRSPDVARQAKATAAIYRNLALELLRAGATLEKATGSPDDALPTVTPDRFATAMLAGLHLHYLADRATKKEPAPIGAPMTKEQAEELTKRAT